MLAVIEPLYKCVFFEHSPCILKTKDASVAEFSSFLNSIIKS